MTTLSPTGDRLSERAEALLDAAMALFAEQGFARTSVGDIQQRAGLTRGSGALYKHFPSKEAILIAGLERHIQRSEEQTAAVPADLDLTDRETLTSLATYVLDQLGAQRAELRIICRDLDDLPALRDAVINRRIHPTYERLAELLTTKAAEGTVRPVGDPAATAAVLLGSLTLHPLLDALLATTPANVERARYAAAWADLTATALTLSRP